MKRQYIIGILCVLWIVSLIVAGVSIDKYIDDQRGILRLDLCDKIKALFDGQESGGVFVTNGDGFFDEAYSGFPVKHFKEVSIPSRSAYNEDEILGIDEVLGVDEISKGIKEKLNEKWEKEYGDLYVLYELNWGDKYPNEHDDGWTINRIHYTPHYPDIIETNMIFPYKVGLKKTEWFSNTYSVEQAVNEAYEFYTTNEKSDYAERFRKGSIRDLWSKIYECENKYFSIAEREKSYTWTAGTPIRIPKGKSYEESQRTMPYENGWMHNGYYRVFIAATQNKVYYVKENEYAVNEDRKNYQIWWMCGLSVLFLIPIIPLLIVEKKTEKRISETLYQRLLRLCNPKEFMQNYDKDKVDKANSIYQELHNLDPRNEEALNSLAKRAIAELNISIIDSEELKAMKEKANPAKYMEPYDAQKVSLANEIYNILSKDNINFEQYKEAKEKLKNL